MDNTPKDSIILAIKYKTKNKNTLYQFTIEQISNFQVQDYFNLKHSDSFQTIYLLVKTSPLPISKPDISFLIRLSDPFQNESFSTTKVNIKLLSSVYQSPNVYPIYAAPANPNLLVVLNSNIQNNTVVYEFRTVNTNNNQKIVYKILNNYSIPFYIDGNHLRILYPFSSLIDPWRTGYLVKFK